MLVPLFIFKPLQESTPPRKGNAFHLVSPYIPARVRFSGKQFNPRRIAHTLDHLAHGFRLSTVYALGLLKPRHALLTLPIQQLIRQPLLRPCEYAMLRHAPVILSQPLAVFEPCNHRDVLKVLGAHHLQRVRQKIVRCPQVQMASLWVNQIGHR